MLYNEMLYFETLSLEKKVSFVFESLQINDLKNTSNAEIKEIEKEIKKDKYKKYFDKLEIPQELKTTFEFTKFDLYIARTFGFGITSLIGPVLNFLNTFKINFKLEEAILLLFAILFSIVNKQTLTAIDGIQNKSILSLIKYFATLGVNKLLEYIAYTSISIPIASNILSSIKGEAINWKQIVGGTALGVGSHLVRSFLNKVQNKMQNKFKEQSIK